jgi:hypothetical protein
MAARSRDFVRDGNCTDEDLLTMVPPRFVEPANPTVIGLDPGILVDAQVR